MLSVVRSTFGMCYGLENVRFAINIAAAAGTQFFRIPAFL